MRDITEIIIHCADTPPEMDIGSSEIRAWHLERGFDDIGYHYVVRRNGVIERGRREECVGAHCYGHNEHSIGVCLVGGKPGCNFTRQQWESFERQILDLTRRYQGAHILGHNDLDHNKRCPGFDAGAWWNRG